MHIKDFLLFLHRYKKKYAVKYMGFGNTCIADWDYKIWIIIIITLVNKIFN